MLVSTVGVCSGSMLVGGMKPEFIVAAVDLSVLDFPAVVVEQHVVNPAQQDSVVESCVFAGSGLLSSRESESHSG